MMCNQIIKKVAASALLVILLVASPKAFALEEVSLFTYYFEPPFFLAEADGTEPKSGLTFDLARLLNRYGKDRYHFNVVALPRKRLDQRLDEGQTAVLPWANANWFKSADRKEFYWSPPYMTGASVLLTNVDEAVVYKGPKSVEHLTLIGVLGHRYANFQEPIAQGRIVRIDHNDYRMILKTLSVRKGVFTITSLINARYLLSSLGLENRVAVVEPFNSTFNRSFLVANTSSELRAFFEDLAPRLARDPQWREILAKYGLQDLALKK